MGTEGAEIISKMAPRAGEAIVTQAIPPTHSATELADILSSAGVDEVTVVGAMSHMCIDATARAASDLGFKTTSWRSLLHARLEFKGKIVSADKVHAALCPSSPLVTAGSVNSRIPGGVIDAEVDGGSAPVVNSIHVGSKPVAEMIFRYASC